MTNPSRHCADERVGSPAVPVPVGQYLDESLKIVGDSSVGADRAHDSDGGNRGQRRDQAVFVHGNSLIRWKTGTPLRQLSLIK